MSAGQARGRRRIAVVGSGVAGLTAAHVASRSASVTLFESENRLGGHADTHEVDGLMIDTGFIVHNRRTYPTLLRLFAELGVATQESEMSMSISDRGTGVEWAGALGARGVFAGPATLRPRHLRMLTEIPRFHRQARALLSAGEGPEGDQTLADFCAEHGYSAYFVRHFLEPLVAAVWSCDPADSLGYPARYLFTFLRHHGMLQIFGSPRWRTVTGGSRTYVERVAAGLDDIRTGTKVVALAETGSGIRITDGNGEVHDFDAAVIATHAGQALGLLEGPTAVQREVLGALTTVTHRAVLHTDTRLLPQARRAWASWNFQRTEDAGGLVVTYDLTRLMRLPSDTHYLVTLGDVDLVHPASVLDTMEYAHPLYTPASVAAQRRLPELDSDRLAFAGAWAGWGFHEDGARSGRHAAERIGCEWGPEPAPLPAPALYDVRVRHSRRSPLRHRFDYSSMMWLVDLDDLPDHGPLARFEARDHLGDPTATIRANVEAFLAAQGVSSPTGRILMLTQARVAGYCFNPITVFYCHDANGEPERVVVEVHNTYGDRHAYLLEPDPRGQAETAKAMYVSPFNDVSGRYRIAVPTPGEQVRVEVSLGDFEAGLSGTRVPITRRTLVHSARLGPLTNRLRIQRQGVGLLLRGLQVRPRPEHREEGTR